MLYCHAPEWIFALTDLSSNAKLILGRVIPLSQDGGQNVYVKREEFAKVFGISERSVSRCFVELEAQGFLEPIPNPNKWSRLRYFKVTAKALSNRGGQIGNIEVDNLTLNKRQVGNIEKENLSTSTEPSWHLSRDNLSRLTRQVGKISLDRSQDRSQDKNIYAKEQSKMSVHTTSNEVSNEAEGLSVEPRKLNEAERPDGGEAALDQLRTAQSAVQKERCVPPNIQGASRKSTHIKYPASKEEVQALMQEWAHAHKNVDARFEQINFVLESEAFYEYWAVDNNWKRNGKAVKSISGTIGTWLRNAVSKVHTYHVSNMTGKGRQVVDDNYINEVRNFVYGGSPQSASGMYEPEYEDVTEDNGMDLFNQLLESK